MQIVFNLLSDIVWLNIIKMQPEGDGLSLDERAYRFFPNRNCFIHLGDEEKSGFGKEKGTRILFHGQIEHDDFEKGKLADFQKFLQAKEYDREYFNPHMLLLFLSGNAYKNEPTFEAMKKHLEFKGQYIRDAEGKRIIQCEKD